MLVVWISVSATQAVFRIARRAAMPVFTSAYASFDVLARFMIASERVTVSGETVTCPSATVWIVPLAGSVLMVVTCLFARSQAIATSATATMIAGIVLFIRVMVKNNRALLSTQRRIYGDRVTKLYSFVTESQEKSSFINIFRLLSGFYPYNPQS